MKSQNTNMNYELAKKLKDAGFPQNNARNGYCLTCRKWQVMKCFKDKHVREFVVVPTLSELIWACASDFGRLVRYSDGTFIAYPTLEKLKTRKEWFRCQSKIPEEAAANLYLSLSTGDTSKDVLQ